MYKIGDKVIAISKSIGNFSFEKSENLRIAREIGQKYLYVIDKSFSDDFYCAYKMDIEFMCEEAFSKNDLIPYKKILEDEI